MINIVSKPPMGIWTGMLNHRVGNFKFIYVDVLVEKAPEPRRRVNPQGRCKRPRPNTLLELLACLNLEVSPEEVLCSTNSEAASDVHLAQSWQIHVRPDRPMFDQGQIT